MKIQEINDDNAHQVQKLAQTLPAALLGAVVGVRKRPSAWQSKAFREITAWSTVVAVHMEGLPVYAEGADTSIGKDAPVGWEPKLEMANGECCFLPGGEGLRINFHEFVVTHIGLIERKWGDE